VGVKEKECSYGIKTTKLNGSGKDSLRKIFHLRRCWLSWFKTIKSKLHLLRRNKQGNI